MKASVKLKVICTMIGKMQPFVHRTGEISALLKEMEDDAAGLDNLLYETLGMSGEDVVRSLQCGSHIV